MVISVVKFIYQATARPQDSTQEYIVETINEATIMLFLYLDNVILNSATPVHFKYQIGWVLIGFAVVNVVVNVSTIAVN